MHINLNAADLLKSILPLQNDAVRQIGFLGGIAIAIAYIVEDSV